MKTLLPNRRTLAVLMLSLFTISTFASAALADRGGNPRWRNGPPGREYRYAPQARYGSRVFIERHSDAGPVLAGLVGGLVLGAMLSHAQQPAVQVRYSYWDPYSDVGFATLGQCQEHIWRYDHPRIVRVIDDSDGRCVRTLYWRHGGWCDDDDD